MRGPNAVTRVLVVEDDNAVAQATLARLSHEGYEVFVAADAISALTVARNAKPDVALLDINLPAGNGFDVARRLDNTVKNVAKIFMTASKAPDLREQALAAGALGFIEKPFTAADLKNAINDAVHLLSKVRSRTA